MNPVLSKREFELARLYPSGYEPMTLARLAGYLSAKRHAWLRDGQPEMQAVYTRFGHLTRDQRRFIWTVVGFSGPYAICLADYGNGVIQRVTFSPTRQFVSSLCLQPTRDPLAVHRGLNVLDFWFHIPSNFPTSAAVLDVIPPVLAD